jgi:hypothetical protein
MIHATSPATDSASCEIPFCFDETVAICKYAMVEELPNILDHFGVRKDFAKPIKACASNRCSYIAKLAFCLLCARRERFVVRGSMDIIPSWEQPRQHQFELDFLQWRL